MNEGLNEVLSKMKENQKERAEYVITKNGTKHMTKSLSNIHRMEKLMGTLGGGLPIAGTDMLIYLKKSRKTEISDQEQDDIDESNTV